MPTREETYAYVSVASPSALVTPTKLQQASRANPYLINNYLCLAKEHTISENVNRKDGYKDADAPTFKNPYAMIKLDTTDYNSKKKTPIKAWDSPEKNLRDELEKMSNCVFHAIVKNTYQSSSNARLPADFSEYLKSARQEYTKALRLARLLKDTNSIKNAPEPFYMGSRYSKNKTLLLDMDETLIHSEELDLSKTQKNHPNKYDFLIEMETNQRVQKIGVHVRPHCMEFLRRMKQKFELVIFTAARQDYADKILDFIDPRGEIFSGRMYRQHCTQIEGSYIKDFSVVKNRRKSDMILVDNLIYSYAADLERGVHIQNFYDDQSDTELLYLATVLESFKSYSDVEESIQRTFGFKKFYDYL